MPSQPRSASEEERRFNLRTLVIASVASAVAALVTSQFWTGGTPIAAAMTPVIVAIVSELLHRPTEKLAQRFTVETDALPEAAGAGPPPREQAVDPQPAREQPSRGADVRMYRTPARRTLPWKAIAVTAVLAFAIGAVVLTLPELIAGQSFGRGGGGTTIFGGKSSGHGKAPAAEQNTSTSDSRPTTSTPQQAPDQQKTSTTTTPPASKTTPQPAPQAAPQQTTPQQPQLPSP